MEDLRKLFVTMFSVVRLDFEGDSFYLVEDDLSRCYLMPSWAVGLFPTREEPWRGYDISGKVFVCLAADAGGEWIKREGKWL